MWQELTAQSSLGFLAQAAPDPEWSTRDFLFQNPWLIVVCMALIIPIVAIIFGTVTEYLRKVRIAEVDATLKRDMLERGMTPEQIKTVLESTSMHRGKHKHRGCA
jgi:hypothetical protein